MNVVLIIPTGIGCEIGGHAGDANPVAKLIGKCCNKLILHPNVVNASDINEMPENALYVEGSILNRFLRGEIYLQEKFYNRILLAVNSPITADTTNAVNAARTTIGANISIVELNTKLRMEGFYKNRKADGKVDGWIELCEQVEDYEFDALAIQSDILVESKTKFAYLQSIGGVNPWGGVEAIASKLIADKLDKPVAHAPFTDISDELYNYHEIVDSRMSAEMISMCFLHCIFKGLHKAPVINYDNGLSVDNVDFLITPINCVGEPHWACEKANIPIIAVKENRNVLNDKMSDEFIIVDNYIEAAGLLMAYSAGINYKSVRRGKFK